MRLDNEEGLRLIENRILEVFCDPRTAETLFGRPRGSMSGLSERAKSGELSLADLGIDLDDVRPALERRRRSGAAPEIEAIRIAYVALAERRDAINAILDHAPAPSAGPRR
jgi:hypothetical protein